LSHFIVLLPRKNGVFPEKAREYFWGVCGEKMCGEQLLVPDIWQK
jgi:hypothetical protein